MLSNYPPGVTGMEPIFGGNDRDCSYEVEATITSYLPLDEMRVLTTKTIIDRAIRHIDQHYMGIAPYLDILTIDPDDPNDDAIVRFNVTLTGDTIVDTSYVYPDDDQDIYDTIREDVDDKMSKLDGEIEFNDEDISYTIHG